MASYDGFKGQQTVSHVMSTIPHSLSSAITGNQLGQVMSIRNAAYHEGKQSQAIDTWAYDSPTDFLAGLGKPEKIVDEKGVVNYRTPAVLIVNGDTITIEDSATGIKTTYKKVS